MAKRIAVTGATGFVGQHLIEALARRGWKLRLLIRKWTPLPSLAGVDAQIVWGDLDDPNALAALVAGTDAIVHAGGLIKSRRPEDFLRVNRDGTARLAALAPQTPFVLLSSLAAREPHLSPYAASKRAAEEAVAARDGPWLAVRAPAVYGPGDRETLAYFRATAWGIAPQPAMPEARLSLIHVTDLAQALALAIDRPPPPAIYEIDDGREGAYSYADMARAAGLAFGRHERPVRLPRSLFGLVARANGAMQSLGGPVRILTGGKVREIFHPDWGVHDRSLATLLGFRARFGLEKGFQDTILWYRARRWL